MAQLVKGWRGSTSGQKKFIASILAYELSRQLDRRRYEVVNESFIDINDLNSEQPDVVVYDKQDRYKPALVIECVSHDNRESAINTLDVLRTIYKLDEAFVYDIDHSDWYHLRNGVNKEPFCKNFNFSMQLLLNRGLNGYLR